MTNKRKILVDAVSVLVLSAVMSVILFVAWDSVYTGVTDIESQFVELLPGVEENGIQVVALFGLGLYLTWAGLFAQDARMRLQGTFVFVGSILALVILGIFGVFIPNMKFTAATSIAFLVGLTIALCTELFEWQGNDYTGNLMNIDFSESSWWGRLNTRDGKVARFPAAQKGVLGILLLVVVFANLALLTGLPTTARFFVASVVVSAAFTFRLYSLLDYDFGAVDAEILGPTGSGKTQFFYAMYLTTESSKVFNRTNSDFGQKANEIHHDQVDGEWGTSSTKQVKSYYIDFVYDKWYWQEGTLSFTDFPGQLLDNLFTSNEPSMRGDGGMSSSEEQSESGGGSADTTEIPGQSDPSANDDKQGDLDMYSLVPGKAFADELIDEGIERPQEIGDMDTEEIAEIISGAVQEGTDETEKATKIKQVVENKLPDTGSRNVDLDEKPADSNRTETSSSSASASTGDTDKQRKVEESLLDADQIICIIDTEAAIKSNRIDINSKKVSESTDDTDSIANYPRLAEMSRICNHENISAEKIILVATKTDLLIDEYKNSDPDRYEPHSIKGDFDEFTRWVRKKYDTNAFPGFGQKETEIYPVYHPTEMSNGRVEPVSGYDEEPQGFEPVLRELVLK